jgi:hypothetical protein
MPAGLFIDSGTRGIILLPGEENSLMDYGPRKTWREHGNAEEHGHSGHSADHQSARDWNKENGETSLRTETEQIRAKFFI